VIVASLYCAGGEVVAARSRCTQGARGFFHLDEKSPYMNRIGYAPGAFDLFHVGHLNILRHAKSQCDFLIAGVVSDEMLKLKKGVTPVVPLAERLEIVRSIRFVDEAVAEVVPDKIDVWHKLQFDVIFKGDDWRGTQKGDLLEREFATVDVEVVYFPYTRTTSSTSLRKALDNINRLAERFSLSRNRTSLDLHRPSSLM
jgi:glycerol-3-phosphate cytidylyltransferase